MPTIAFDNVAKSFGGTTVIERFDAEIPDQEFLVLLGPSGCGKSTMLRMIAGLADISSGEIRFDGVRVNEQEPRERNVAFVFQSYALYPHMTVRENIAFPLIMDRFSKWYHVPILNSIMRRVIARRPEVRERVEQVATTLELDGYLDRRPKALSGGQRQRVALARALVRDPALYLLDEPLSNLDAKLRAQMRAEISALHRRVGKSFVYVTHDQVEAMTMATRIIVLNKGVIQQIGTPAEIYAEPANTFVARFIGSPPMNLVPVTVEGGTARIAENGADTGIVAPTAAGELLLGVRPERLALADPDAARGVTAYVASVENLGGETVVGFRFHDPQGDTVVAAEDARVTHHARIPGTPPLVVGDPIVLSIPADGLSWFDGATGQRLEATVEVAA
jgi:multiple sugar transport system ATP-binding protein